MKEQFSEIYKQTVEPLRSNGPANTISRMIEYVKLFSDTLSELDKKLNEKTNQLATSYPELKEQLTNEYHLWMERFIEEFKPGRKE